MDIMKSRMAIHPKRSPMDVRHPRHPAILGPKEKRSLLAQQKLSADMAVSPPVSSEMMEPPKIADKIQLDMPPSSSSPPPVPSEMMEPPKDADIVQLDKPPSASAEKPSSPEETQLPEEKVQPKKKQPKKD